MRLALLLMAGIAAAGPVSSQQVTAPPPACKSPENRTLDFWVGDWDALDDKGNLIGTNRITRDEYGDCVITEHFDGSGLIGHSVSVYRPGLKQWRQVWVDNQGGYFDLVGGPVTGTDHIFYFENKRVTDAQPFQRMIWQDVEKERNDGSTEEEKGFVDDLFFFFAFSGFTSCRLCHSFQHQIGIIRITGNSRSCIIFFVFSTS